MEYLVIDNPPDDIGQYLKDGWKIIKHEYWNTSRHICNRTGKTFIVLSKP